MSEKFGKEIKFIRIGVENKALLNHFYHYSVAHGKDVSFDSEMFEKYIVENHSTHATGLRKRDFDKKIIGRFLTLLRKRGAITSTLKRAFKGQPQVYIIRSNTFVIPDGNIPVNGVKPKRKLTLDDVDRFDGYDLAFIGYTFRKELDILSQCNESLEAENKSLKEEAQETNVKPYIAKIEAMQREHYSELKDKDRSIKELQSQNGKVNQKLIDANREIDQLKKALERYQRKSSTFKMDEVAKITKKHERPAHLRR